MVLAPKKKDLRILSWCVHAGFAVWFCTPMVFKKISGTMFCYWILEQLGVLESLMRDLLETDYIQWTEPGLSFDWLLNYGSICKSCVWSRPCWGRLFTRLCPQLMFRTFFCFPATKRCCRVLWVTNDLARLRKRGCDALLYNLVFCFSTGLIMQEERACWYSNGVIWSSASIDFYLGVNCAATADNIMYGT